MHVVIPQMPIGESNSPDGDDRLQLKKRKFTFDLGLLAGLPFRRLEGGLSVFSATGNALSPFSSSGVTV